MGRFDNLDYDGAKRAAEEADTSMFIAKRMPDDQRFIHVMFLELPIFGSVTYDSKIEKKGQANVAAYNTKTGEYEGIFMLEMAPKHMTLFLSQLSEPENGVNKLYEIKRYGAKNYKHTVYSLKIIREMTPEEMAFMETVPLHERFAKRDDDTTPATPPQSPPPAPAPTPEAPPQGDHAPEATDEAVFGEALRVEMRKRGWKQKDYQVANKKYLGSDFQKFPDLDPVERQDILTAIRVLPNDAQATDIVYRGELGDDLDLESDVDFF